MRWLHASNNKDIISTSEMRKESSNLAGVQTANAEEEKVAANLMIKSCSKVATDINDGKRSFNTR